MKMKYYVQRNIETPKRLTLTANIFNSNGIKNKSIFNITQININKNYDAIDEKALYKMTFKFAFLILVSFISVTNMGHVSLFIRREYND